MCAGLGGELGPPLMIAVFTGVYAILFCVWVAAIASLATTGAIFGWVIGGSIPLWVSILTLMFSSSMISRPLRHARRAIYWNTSGYTYFSFAAWYEIFSTAVLILSCGFASTH